MRPKRFSACRAAMPYLAPRVPDIRKPLLIGDLDAP